MTALIVLVVIALLILFVLSLFRRRINLWCAEMWLEEAESNHDIAKRSQIMFEDLSRKVLVLPIETALEVEFIQCQAKLKRARMREQRYRRWAAYALRQAKADTR